MRARACRSASKRATTCCVSMPGLSTFRATSRRTGSGLLGHEDHPESALADLLQQLVRADDSAGPLGRGFIIRDGQAGSGGFEKAASRSVCCHQVPHPVMQGLVAATRFDQVSVPKLRCQLDGGNEDVPRLVGARIHSPPAWEHLALQCAIRPAIVRRRSEILFVVRGSLAAVQFVMQPGPRVRPVIVGGRARQAAHFSGLLDGQPREVSQADELSGFCVLLRELGDCLVD